MHTYMQRCMPFVPFAKCLCVEYENCGSFAISCLTSFVNIQLFEKWFEQETQIFLVRKRGEYILSRYQNSSYSIVEIPSSIMETTEKTVRKWIKRFAEFDNIVRIKPPGHNRHSTHEQTACISVTKKITWLDYIIIQFSQWALERISWNTFLEQFINSIERNWQYI